MNPLAPELTLDHSLILMPFAYYKRVTRWTLPQLGLSPGTNTKAHVFDFVITVCDNAKERCPFWPGQPIIAHWPSPDPADFVGTEEETYRHFWQVSRQIHRRLEIFCSLPFDKLDRLRLEHATKEIGKTDNTTAQDND